MTSPLSNFYPNVPLTIDLRYRLPREKAGGLSVLNVGVGTCDSGLARQLPFWPFAELDHLDTHEDYLRIARTFYWEAAKLRYINANLVDFSPANYDWVLTFDVLEHVTKDDALFFMAQITGNHLAFIPLEKEFRTNHSGVEEQDHKSLWTEDDFKDLGYATQVLKGFHNQDGVIFDAMWAFKKKP